MESPDLVELLAHLDDIVAGPKTWSLQIDDAESEERIHNVCLELAQRLDFEYTSVQIRERLLQEFRLGDDFPDYNFPLLFLHGSLEMVKLGPDMRDLVKKRLSGIQRAKTLLPRRLRSQSVMSTPSAKATTKFKPPTRSSRSSAKPSAKSGAVKNHAKSLRSNATTPKRSPFKARNRSKKSSRKPKMRLESGIPGDEISETPSHSPLSTYSVRDLPSPCPVSQETPNRLQTQSILITINNKSSADVRNAYEATESPFPPVSQIELKIDLISELAHYKLRYEIAEQECENAKKAERQLWSDISQTQGVSEKLIKELHKKTKQIIELRKHLNNQHDLKNYLSSGHDNGEASISHQIFSRFKTMKEEIASIRVINGSDKLFIGPFLNQSSDIGVLLRTVLECSHTKAEELLDVSPALTLCEVIQSLTGAAIHLWVFQAEYLPEIMMNTPLLQRYRDHIATLCGHDRLCDLDTIVHQSIIEEQNFSEFTSPRIASKHAARLFDALQPFLEQQLHCKTVENLKRRLDLIFGLAVQIRSFSLVAREEYESIWPLFGSSIDANEMESEHMGSENTADLVRLPLSPGLRVFSKSKELVGYHGFEAKDRARGTLKYVIKALVLI